MKNVSTIVAGMLATLVIGTASVQAVPISGSIDILGIGDLQTTAGSKLGTATGISGTTGTVFFGDGSFAGTAGSSVGISPFMLNPVSTPVSPLWSFTVDGLTYSFDLLAMTVKLNNFGLLYITGTGSLSITGVGSSYDETAGTWTYADSKFGFLSSNTADSGSTLNVSGAVDLVPDGGLTIMLLGVALSGFYFFRKHILV